MNKIKVYNTSVKLGKFGAGLVASASVGAVMGHLSTKIIPTDLPMPKKVLAVVGFALITMYVADTVSNHLVETLDQIFPTIPEPDEECTDDQSSEPVIEGEVVE